MPQLQQTKMTGTRIFFVGPFFVGASSKARTAAVRNTVLQI
jgi:hypothetical protein